MYGIKMQEIKFAKQSYNFHMLINNTAFILAVYWRTEDAPYVQRVTEYFIPKESRIAR